MKKKVFLGIIAFVAIIGFSMTACDIGSGNDNGNGNDTGPTPTPGGNVSSTSGELTITALGDYNGKWVFAWQFFSSYARSHCPCGGNAADCSCDEGECGCEGCANYAPEPPDPTSFLLAGENFNINISQESMTYYGAQISGGQAKLKVWSVDVETGTLGSYNGNDKKVFMGVMILNKPSITSAEFDTHFGDGDLEADFTAGKATAAFTTWGDN
jgi:hypothetical protein